jgi:hypothetical protein
MNNKESVKKQKLEAKARVIEEKIGGYSIEIPDNYEP